MPPQGSGPVRGAALSIAAGVLLAGAGALHAAPAQDPGRAVYNRHCYFCHGYSGDARTVAASVLSPRPRDFTTGPALDRERMLASVRSGRAGTAMQPFDTVLDARQMEAVVDYVRDAFMTRRERNLLYHSPANGWTGDPHASPAAPYVTGALAVDAPDAPRDASARAGRALYLSACVTCHARGPEAALTWRNEAVTYPIGNYLEHEAGHEDAVTGVFEQHERPPVLASDSALLRTGERVYQANCAHCHAEDGTGRNWIGSFLDPPPPDFTRAGGPPRDHAELVRVVREGTAGTAMPAWSQVLDAGEVDAVVAYLRAVFARYAAR